MFVEGESVDTNQTHEEYFELRIDGPYFNQNGKNEYKVTSDINVLCSAIIGEDSHRIHRLAGSIATMFTTIGVYKLGSGLDDDGTFIDCLQRDAELKILHFGQIQVKVPLMQAAVTAKYTATLLL